MSQDSIEAFEHDHAELNRQVLDLGILVRRLDHGGVDAWPPVELVSQLQHLRDDLFLHLAREEEGLFPFVAAALPSLAGEIAEMSGAHDMICGAIARMIHLVQSEAPSPAAQVGLVAALYERFEATYERHARTERTFLQAVGSRLSLAQRTELSEIVRGL